MRSYVGAKYVGCYINNFQATATKYKYRAIPLTSITAHAIEKTIEWRAANAALLQRAKDGLKHPQESKFR